MPIKIVPEHISQLIGLESTVKYDEPPEDGQLPFVVISRPSPILLSAPHGARAYRNSCDQEWHEEDEYTASIAILLGELCQTSVIATIARNDDYDPNFAPRCSYKKRLESIAADNGGHFVIDLHGAGDTSLQAGRLVDLGTRKRLQSLSERHLSTFVNILQKHLGEGSVNQNRFGACNPNTITGYSQTLGLQAVQVEMTPNVRIAKRRPEASNFGEKGEFTAESDLLVGMLQALVDFIEYLKTTAKEEAL